MSTKPIHLLTVAAAVFLTALSAFGQATYFSAITNLDPMAYWPMHEVAAPAPGDIETNYGTLGPLGTGFYPDWAGGGNTATVRGTNGALAGDLDPAVYFTQAGGIPNALYVPQTSPMVTLIPPFSVECWFYNFNPSGAQYQGDIWSQEGYEGLNAGGSGGGAGNVCGIRLFWNATGLIVYTFKNSSTLKNVFSTVAASAAAWHHVVVTSDANTNLSIYVDGTQMKTTVAGYAFYAPDSWTPFEVGNGRGNTRPYGGTVDEVAIYRTNLDATTIAAHHTAGLDPGASPSYFQVVTNDRPVVYLRMDGPVYNPPDASTWPVLTNYGHVALNGVYSPGTMPGLANGPATPNGTPYSGMSGPKVPHLSGVSSFADAGYAPTFDPTGPVPFTVAAVFRGNPCDNRFQTMVGHSDNSWRIAMTTTGKLQCQLGTNSSSLITSAGVYNDGQWHQVVEVYAPAPDPAALGTHALYVDGVLDSSVTTVTTNGIGPGSPLNVLIGGDPQYTNTPSGLGRQFAGQVCEVALFTNALTASQVQGLYNALGVPPSIITQPIAATVNAGVAFTNSVVATGPGPLSYQWYRDDFPLPLSGQTNLPNGATNATLVINPVLASDASADYYLVVTNSSGAVTSAVVSLTVLTLPAFLSEPLLATHTNHIRLFAGAAPTFKVSASGSQPLYYQWFTNGVAATASAPANTNYTLPPARLNGGVASFDCVASNFVGQATCATISITALPDPTAPYPAAVLAASPVGYWRLNEPDYDSQNNGAIANDYRGGCNGIYTNTILGQPGYNPSTDPLITAAAFGFNGVADNDASGIGIDFSAPLDTSAVFSIEAWVSGNPQNKDAGIVSKGYGGAEQFSLDTGANGGSPTHAFRFFVRDAVGTAHIVNSAVAPDAGSQAWHHLVGVCDETNGYVTFYVDGFAAGSTAISPDSGVLASARPMMIGARPSNATVTASDLQFAGSVNDVAVYNYALSASQVAAHYFSANVQAALFVTPPTSVTVGAGDTLVIPAMADGTPPLSYVWYDVFGGTNVATGATNGNVLNAALRVPNVPVGWNGAALQLTVSNAFGTASTYVTLTVASGAPQILTDVQTPLRLWLGSSASESVTAVGSFPLHYQWQQGGSNLADNGRVIGSHSNVLALAYAQAGDAGDYWVIISNAYGSVTSSVAVFLVGGLPLGFGTNGAGWSVNESGAYSTPAFADSVLTLTDGGLGEARSAFFNYQQSISVFKAAFTYQAGGNRSADGVTFCLQNDARGASALGGGGAQLGVGTANPITPSIALELNLYGGGQIPGYTVLANGLTAASGGNGNYRPLGGGITLNSGHPINITVAYAHGQMALAFLDTVTGNSSSADVAVGHLEDLLGGSTAFVGFTGSDRGNYSSSQTISNFSFVSWPTETIQLSGANVVISWPAAVAGYTLQQNADLTPGNWLAVTNVPIVANGQNQVTLSAGSNKLFYRLALPTP